MQLHSIAATIQLTSSSGDGAACPNDPVVFTCTVAARTSLLWTLNPPPNHMTTEPLQLVVRGSNGIGNQEPAGPEGFVFQAAVTAISSDSLTSTLTTLTEVSSLNGTTVSCTGDQNELLTIIVAGELIKSIFIH